MRRIPLGFLVLIACGGTRPMDTDGGARVRCGDGTSASSTPISGPVVGEGGNDHDSPFRALAIDPTDPDVVYVGSEGNGLFKSTDGGASWQWLRNGLRHCEAYPEIYAIAIDPEDPASVLLATNAGPGPARGDVITALAGVYHSADGGSTFVQRNLGLPTGDANSVAFSPASSETIFVGLGGQQSTNANDDRFYPGGLFVSHDLGATWTPAAADGPITLGRLWQLVVRGPAADFSLYTFGVAFPFDAARTAGFVVGAASGTSFTALPEPLREVDGAYFDVSADGQTLYLDQNAESGSRLVWKSTNGGATFTHPPEQARGPIRIVGADPDVVLYADGPVLSRSTDGMDTGTPVLTMPAGDHDIAAIEVAPGDASIVYVTAKGLLVYRSDDGGASFDAVADLRAFIVAH